MDNVLVDFASGIARLAPDVVAQFEGRLDEVPGIFARMDPMPRAVESFNELAGLFDTYVLSTSPWENPTAWSDKLLWVKRHLGQSAHKRLILTHHKDLNHGDYLVDDRTKNGADRFVGEHIHFGTHPFPDWSSVLAYLRQRARSSGVRQGAPAMATLEDVLAETFRSQRVCPRPPQWASLYKLLPETRQTSAGSEPALPLILAAWWNASPEEKAARLREHIEWADSHGALDVVHRFLRSLPETDWHHEGE